MGIALLKMAAFGNAAAKGCFQQGVFPLVPLAAGRAIAKGDPQAIAGAAPSGPRVGGVDSRRPKRDPEGHDA
jgi:hypothetical protein